MNRARSLRARFFSPPSTNRAPVRPPTLAFAEKLCIVQENIIASSRRPRENASMDTTDTAIASTVVTYSPTGTTRRVCAAVAAGLGASSVSTLDMTPNRSADVAPATITDDVAIIGVPVYTGRVAAEAVARLQNVRADDVPAVLVVVYGNRAFEDALVELRDLALKAGFRPVAAAAFIGEHSYSRPGSPLAGGRPDAEDLARAREFGEAVLRRLQSPTPPADAEPLALPGNTPYRNRSEMPSLAPERIAERCTGCGRCVDACPTGAIPPDGSAADAALCTLCCACVKACPEQARVLTGTWMEAVTAKLSAACATRCEPEIFMNDVE